ncbi:amino acid adenylation domain-containing protein [Nocardia sp. KC 131]|uniref:amino acid adenylation domain-containing protein n=1 Tax=Nocardia arseniciresistens TaxID=3392119 RepID=UPI00398E7579
MRGTYERGRHSIHLLADPKTIADPSVYQRAVHELDPVFWDDVGKVWVCTGYRESLAVLRDSARFGSARLRSPADLSDQGFTEIGRITGMLSRQMLFLDPPAHTAIRTVLKPAFNPAAVAAREKQVQKIVEDLLAKLPQSGRLDIVEGLAGQLPTLLIASLLGLDHRVSEVYAWAEAYETFLGGLSTLPDIRDQAIIPILAEAYGALRSEASIRRGGTGEDLVTILANGLAGAELSGDTLAEALDLVAANALVLIGGGYQTLTQLIAMGIVLLARHPEQLDMLRAEPELISDVIDEVMRMEGSSQYVGRRATEAVSLAGHDISEGESILVLLAAANRDPRQFSDPDRFDIVRREGKHLGFASGRHHCVGSVDAQQAAQLALLAFVDKYESFSVVDEDDAIIWGGHANTRSPQRVLLTVRPHAAVAHAIDAKPPVEARAEGLGPEPGTEAEWMPTDSAPGLELEAEAARSRPDSVPGHVGRARPWHRATTAEVDRLRSRNNRPISLDGERLWMDVVARFAVSAPHSVALRQGGRQMSYRELDRGGDVVAGRMQALGVEPGVVVGVLMPRSFEQFLGALGTARAGGALLLADLACPRERLRTMLAEAGVSVICAHARAQSLAQDVLPVGARVVVVDADEISDAERPREVVPGLRLGDTAYVVFTSGSTGTPKAISVDHEALLNLQVAVRQVFRATPADRILQWFSPNFDGWHFDMTVGLTAGAALVLAPEANVCTGPTLAGIVRDEAVTIASLTPSAWQTCSFDQLPGLRIAAAAGEPVPAGLVRQLAAPNRRVLNLYGPAEAAIWTTWYECRADESDPPIGEPIVNKYTYVLDADGRPVVSDEIGELWIGGVGIGRYVHQPDLMRERFRPDLLAGSAGRLMYATGDMCRWRPDGRLEYVGRLDRQVKVRGQRIELDEVERILVNAPGIRHAAVTIEGERLVATVVTDASVFDEAAVKAHLRGRLHSGMIPALFRVVDEPRLSINGKLRLSPVGLPTPSVSPPEAQTAGIESGMPERPTASARWTHTRLVWALAQLFATCLRLPQMRVRDTSDFFELGGDSLSFVDLLSGIEQRLDLVVTVDSILETSTPAGVADHVLAQQLRLAE